MTTTAAASMYVDQAIQFRNPFAAKDSTLRHAEADVDISRPDWPYSSRGADFSRALTPPPDMNGVPRLSKPDFYQQEHGHHYGHRMSGHPASRAAGLSQEASLVNGISPSHSVDAEVVHESSAAHAPHRRPSQAVSIAVNFQIPSSVSSSGGSLSELAAQITCLFWFESSELLQQVEDSSIPLHAARPLVADAKPTTGFRKWVTTILSTTCVAQNVVLLALLFIFRLKKMNPSVRGKSGSEYRLLTVALMLGNKFLDDNTYTNKTWAEVSGINVGEVHIMEVEFLSNMKYCLFTSERDWAQWQTLLGKFSTFFDRAVRPLPAQPPALVLPPASSLHLPMALPSPPASNQASPPYAGDYQHIPVYTASNQHGLTPAPSPLGTAVDSGVTIVPPKSRKRSLDDFAEPPPKRVASGYTSYTSPQRFSTMPAQAIHGPPVPRLPLPSLSIPTAQAFAPNTYQMSSTQSAQLPPLGAGARAMALVYPATTSQTQTAQVSALSGLSSQAQPQMAPQHQTRLHSPYGSSTSGSPTGVLPQSATSLQPTTQVSPSYYLRQRDSPYRPVYHVSTLLHPPPSTAMQAKLQNVNLRQMHYQPLGKQQPQTGQLPYIGQNLWVDGTHPQEMTPVHQWPGFRTSQQPTAVPR